MGESLDSLELVISQTPKNNISPLTTMKSIIAGIITKEKFDKHDIKKMFHLLYHNRWSVFNLERVYERDHPTSGAMIPLFIAVSDIDDDSENAFQKALAVLRQYIIHGIDINQDIEGQTVLELALNAGNYRIVNYLLNPNVPIRLSQHPIFLDQMLLQPVHIIFIKNFYPQLPRNLIFRLKESHDVDQTWTAAIEFTYIEKVDNIPIINDINDPLNDPQVQEFIDSFSTHINKSKGSKIKKYLYEKY